MNTINGSKPRSKEEEDQILLSSTTHHIGNHGQHHGMVQVFVNEDDSEGTMTDNIDALLLKRQYDHREIGRLSDGDCHNSIYEDEDEDDETRDTSNGHYYEDVSKDGDDIDVVDDEDRTAASRTFGRSSTSSFSMTLTDVSLDDSFHASQDVMFFYHDSDCDDEDYEDDDEDGHDRAGHGSIKTSSVYHQSCDSSYDEYSFNRPLSPPPPPPLLPTDDELMMIQHILCLKNYGRDSNNGAPTVGLMGLGGNRDGLGRRIDYDAILDDSMDLANLLGHIQVIQSIENLMKKPLLESNDNLGFIFRNSTFGTSNAGGNSSCKLKKKNGILSRRRSMIHQRAQIRWHLLALSDATTLADNTNQTSCSCYSSASKPGTPNDDISLSFQYFGGEISVFEVMELLYRKYQLSSKDVTFMIQHIKLCQEMNHLESIRWDLMYEIIFPEVYCDLTDEGY